MKNNSLKYFFENLWFWSIFIGINVCYWAEAVDRADLVNGWICSGILLIFLKIYKDLCDEIMDENKKCIDLSKSLLKENIEIVDEYSKLFKSHGNNI